MGRGSFPEVWRTPWGLVRPWACAELARRLTRPRRPYTSGGDAVGLMTGAGSLQRKESHAAGTS
jgi:hypothetical protein